MENTINTEGCRKPNWIPDRDKEILCFYLVIPKCGFKLNYCALVNHLDTQLHCLDQWKNATAGASF